MSQAKKNKKDKLYTASKNKKNDSYDHDKIASVSKDKTRKILGIFPVSQKGPKLDCPDKTKKKAEVLDNSYANSTKASLVRSSKTVNFDVVQLEDVHLDIPAFKQFKNNMTDFTSDGEQQFHEIILKIGVFLGTNHEGKGVSLKIMGSASQIPTSFDPTKPNNNINPDGSSIYGKTSIENNRLLAKARADELAKKIKEIFPSINVITPSLDEIKIGETKWTPEVQAALNEAVVKKEKEAVQAIYEPFQKDQWVKVESKERSSRKVKPESIKMYMVSTTPNLKTSLNGEETPIKSVFIISKKTFEEIGDHLIFSSVEGRDKFLESHGLSVYSEVKNGVTRWYLLQDGEEVDAFHIKDYTERVYKLYELGIVDNMDEEILENKIIADVRKANGL